MVEIYELPCSTTPVAVTGITEATGVSAGGEYACALLSSGNADCWGENGGGELGDGENKDSSTPVKVKGLASATSITAAVSHGESHVCALYSGGSIDCWGAGGSGDLGNGTTGAEECGGALSFSPTCDLTPVSVHAITTGSSVSAGSADTCAVLSSGKVDCWGFNDEGELGDGTDSGPETCGEPEDRFACSLVPVSVNGITQATAVSAGSDYACALLSSGSVECWGENESGELGDGTNKDSSVPVPVIGFG